MILLLACLIGFLAVRGLGRELGVATQLSLGAAVGIGAISCCFFVELVSGIPSLACEVVLLAATAAICWRTRARGVKTTLDRWEIWPAAACGLALAAAICGFFVLASARPNGDWDAWAAWNLHARFLATPSWRDLFNPAISWTHADYPLLLPGFLARAWRAAGQVDLLTPRVVAFLLTFGAVGLLGGSIARLKGRTSGLLAAVFLAATPTFVELGAAQYADVAFSFFLLAMVALYAQEERAPWSWGLAALAGICAGMAAWTKNEGLLLVALMVPIRAISIRRRPARMTAFAAGLAPVLALMLFFRLDLAPANANFAGRSAGALAGLLWDAHRWKVVLAGLVKGVAGLGGLPVGVPLVLAAWLACAGIDSQYDRTALRTGIAMVAAQLAGYCAILVLSPYEIGWQVDTALPRLLLQLWPATIFLAFLAAPQSARSAASVRNPATAPRGTARA